MNVIRPSIPMRTDPNETSSLETECLFGETITILDTYQDFLIKVLDFRLIFIIEALFKKT